MIRYGVVSHNHDAAIAVFDDKKLLFASQSERFSKIKNDPLISPALAQYCVERFGPPDQIHYFEIPTNRIHLLNGRLNKLSSQGKLTRYLRKLLGERAKVSFGDHHRSHAATGVHTSGFDQASIIVLDAIGQTQCLSIYEYGMGVFNKIKEQHYPHSMGLFFAAMTARLGLKPNQDEYILMGMAAHGLPLYKDSIKEEFFSDFGVDLKLKYDCHRSIDWWGKFPKSEYFNIAASVQAIFEDYVVELVKWTRLHTQSKNLVLAGGCFLNCVANSVIAKLNLFEHIWINPNPGDGGSAIGAVTSDIGSIEYKNSFLGYDLGCNSHSPEEIVRALLRGTPIGIAQGAAEFGPRALGNRSLLLDPRLPSGKAILNATKRRQEFRPFAPAILAEHADEYFELDQTNYEFMQYVVRHKTRSLPASSHADRTARVQVVKPDGSFFRAILEHWYDMTGCPALINTSLNIKDKPIVNDKEDINEFEQTSGIRVFS